VAEVADKAQALQREAADNADKMESLQAALRQEANAAELEQADQRRLGAHRPMLALESMRQKSPQIQSDLKQAQQAQQSQPQAKALAKRCSSAEADGRCPAAARAASLRKMENGGQVPQENLG